jgi:hypothetical protein
MNPSSSVLQRPTVVVWYGARSHAQIDPGNATQNGDS